MNKYNESKIYRIIDNTNGNQYVGSTYEKTLAQRLTKHRDGYKRYINGIGHFMTSFNILKNGDYDIVLIENYNCNSKDELHARERYWIENTECVNKYIPTRTKEEYYEQNKEQISQKCKEYYDAHKEKIIEKSKEYYEQNREKIAEYNKEYREINKEQLTQKKKEYYEQNREQRNEKSKEYAEKNKEQLKEKAKQKFICDCGSCIRIVEKARHFRTKKHLEYLNQQS